MANAKHWVMNNQETDRGTVDENVDERTRFEIYYPPFEGAIEAGVGSFMCSYNKINGNWSCENNSTLTTDLRDRLGFKGYVMSDWGATHSVSLPLGLDQEMDGNLCYNCDFPLIHDEDGLKTLGKEVMDPALDLAVYRILYAHARLGTLFSAFNQTGTIDKNVSTPEHKMVARELAEESAVLLMNKDNTLPLDFDKYRNILMMG